MKINNVMVPTLVKLFTSSKIFAINQFSATFFFTNKFTPKRLKIMTNGIQAMPVTWDVAIRN